MKDSIIKYMTSDLSIKSCLPQMISEDDLKVIINDVLIEFSSQVAEIKAGNEKLLQFIIGKTMAKVSGKAPANLVKEELIKAIG